MLYVVEFFTVLLVDVGFALGYYEIMVGSSIGAGVVGFGCLGLFCCCFAIGVVNALGSWFCILVVSLDLYLVGSWLYISFDLRLFGLIQTFVFVLLLLCGFC